MLCRRLTGPDTTLFIRRSASAGGDFAGYWCFPGGKLEAGETAEDAAERDAVEEIGPNPHGMPIPWTHSAGADVVYDLFLTHVHAEFVARLNDEHTAWCWAPPSDPPVPLHPGCWAALDKLTGMARAEPAVNNDTNGRLDAALVAARRLSRSG